MASGLVAAVVYCVGGCVYQRTVMHARGWRQIPHYHAWAGTLGFFWVRFLLPLNVFHLFSSSPTSLPTHRAFEEEDAKSPRGSSERREMQQ